MVNKVLFLTNVPAPYTVDFFSQLGLKCDLTVLFERKEAFDREKNWTKYENTNFQGIYLKGIPVSNDLAFCADALHYLRRKRYDAVIIGNYSSPTGMLAILYLKIKKIPFILHVDGGLIKQENRIKKWMKHFLISSASFYFSSGNKTTEYLSFYGACKNRIYKYPFTSVSSRDILVSLPDKSSMKKKLKIKETQMVISVGQMIPRKGFDVLLEAASLNSREIGYYLIGGAPYEELKWIVKEKNLTNVYFIPFMPFEKLKEYLKAADLFVLMTREDIWGLVVNEAVAMGLPVISTDQCVAALEIIEDGINGYIVKNEDAKEAARRIKELLKNPLLREQIGKNNLEAARRYSIENMAEEYFKGIGKFVKK